MSQVDMVSKSCYNGAMADKEQEQDQETRMTVRIPSDIAERLRQLAKQHDRSLNGEIVRALREYTEKHRDAK